MMFFVATGARVHADEARFLYDELGRLKTVIDGNGNSATYSYDAVGNLLSITREDVIPAGVSITVFNPKAASVGTEVIIFGSGFSKEPNQNTVTFNGTAAIIVSATETEIRTHVPEGATSGLLSVRTPSGNALSKEVFTLTTPFSISISPAQATVVAGSSIQFSATLLGSENKDFLWRLEGAGVSIGTLSDTGVYTVPATFLDTALIFIKVVSLADISKSATAKVVVLPQGLSSLHTSPFISVAFDRTLTSTGPFITPPVSIEFQQLSPPSGPFVSPKVSVSFTPIISAIIPNSGFEGTVLQLTINGKGLASATAINVLLDGVADPNIGVDNVAASSDGTKATALLTISNSAPPGLRVLRITTPNSTSPAAVMEGNTFRVAAP
jgi:YD repeat-containing protein